MGGEETRERHARRKVMNRKGLISLIRNRPERTAAPLFNLGEIREYYLTTDPEKFK